jgi:hypothetical protein
MIDRYRKSGGFLQLLNVIETCGITKQEKFLKIIEEEAPAWGEAIRKKMISIHRIFAWSPEALAEVISRLPSLTIAVAVHGLTPQQVEKLDKIMTLGQKRKVEEHNGTAKPTLNEISAAFIKIITDVREMVHHGILKLDKIDPELYVDEDIEDRLLGGSASTVNPVHEEAKAKEPAELVFDLDRLRASSGSHPEEVEALKKKVKYLNTEMESLRREHRILQDKLAQIRKIA